MWPPCQMQVPEHCLTNRIYTPTQVRNEKISNFLSEEFVILISEQNMYTTL